MQPAPKPIRWMVRHDTLYRYDVPVVFSPHLVRLNPVPGRVRQISRQLDVDPRPMHMRDETDAFGNLCTRIQFGPEPSQELRLDSRLVVEPLGICMPDEIEFDALPWPIPEDDPLAAFRGDEVPTEVRAFAQKLASETEAAPLPFLDHVCRTLFTRTDRRVRPAGAAQSPQETLASATGACRDLTVLFLAISRAMGIAGRFVSGYQGAEPTVDGNRHLHAWPELWLPGPGWVGWDPMYGIRAGAGHIPVCAAPDQAATMPIEGGFSFVGDCVRSTLEYAVSIQELP